MATKRKRVDLRTTWLCMQHACTRAACSCTWRARRLHVLKENLRLYDSRSTIFTKTSNVSRISNVSRTPLFAIAVFCKKPRLIIGEIRYMYIFMYIFFTSARILCVCIDYTDIVHCIVIVHSREKCVIMYASYVIGLWTGYAEHQQFSITVWDGWVSRRVRQTLWLLRNAFGFL